MRFFVTRDIRKNPILRSLLLWSLLYVLVFWLTNGLFYVRIGLTPQRVITYYRGSEAMFRSPRSFFSLLEETHFHAFAMMILLMTLGHLLIFTSLKAWKKRLLIHTTFGSAFLDMTSGWLIRYLNPVFAYVKIASFLALQVSLFLVLLVITFFLWKNKAGRGATTYSERGNNEPTLSYQQANRS